MPEEQNVWGDKWNQRFNSFCIEVLGWKQLGTSNNDIYCQQLKKAVGIDSVFSYKRNSKSRQQIIFIEAKTRADMKNIRKGQIESWINNFLRKIENIPAEQEFKDKFLPEENAIYQIGLIGLWIRDSDSYSNKDIQRYLTEVDISTKKSIKQDIYFIDNFRISFLCEVHKQYKRIKSDEAYNSTRFYFPQYGDQPIADGNCIPIEWCFSAFVFCKSQKIRRFKNGSDVNLDTFQAFYNGKIENYEDLNLIGLAFKYFQMIDAEEIDIYLLCDTNLIRNYIEKFKASFDDLNTDFIFHNLSISNALPGWLDKYD